MKARPVKKLDPQRSLDENAARILLVRLDELRSFATDALRPERSDAQHDMRIAAKRLRYVLEITGFCFGPAGDRARRSAKELQEILGELHDCDVMLPRVIEHGAELRTADAARLRELAGEAEDLDPQLVRSAAHRTAYRGLEAMAVYLQARRDLLFDRFRELWAGQEERGTWASLEEAAERGLEQARERRRVRKAGNLAARRPPGSLPVGTAGRSDSA